MRYVYRGTPKREKRVREIMEENRQLFGDAYEDFLDWTGGDVIPAEFILEDIDEWIKKNRRDRKGESS